MSVTANDGSVAPCDEAMTQEKLAALVANVKQQRANKLANVAFVPHAQFDALVELAASALNYKATKPADRLETPVSD